MCTTTPAMLAASDLAASALCDLLLQLHADADSGAIRPLPDYLVRFPGSEVAVAREYLRFLDSAAEAPVPLPGSDTDVRLLDKLAIARPRIDRYAIGAELGRGGMGRVLAARDLELDRELAMKMIARDGPSARRRLLAEARITGRLDHPGVVPVHELGFDRDGRLFFTMRLVEGIDFERAIERVHARDNEWTPSRALEVLVKVCDTLAFAHARGVVHRDLKPANVMVGRFGEAYVMDWGLARTLRDEGQSEHDRADAANEIDTDTPGLTRDGDVLGTPSYMPPEQADGRAHEIDPRADVYACGAMLYQLLSGRRPYAEPGREPAFAELLERVRAGPPVALKNLRRDAPVELVAICEKAMQRIPARRYANMGEMASDLRAFLERRVVEAHDTGMRARTFKWIARNRALALMLGLIAAGAAVGSGAVQYQRATARDRLIHLSGSQLARTFDQLWPPRPESLPVLERWLADARGYLASHTENLALLEKLRSRALPLNPSRPAELQARADIKARLRSRVAWLAELRKFTRDPEPGRNRLSEYQDRAWAHQEIELHERELASDRVRPTPHLTFEFENPDDQRLHDALVRVVLDQAEFEGDGGRLALVPLAEWGLAASREVASRSLDDARECWRNAIASIGDEHVSPAYRGLCLAPQLGLVPVGRDPDSGLWEFAVVLSGEVPARGPDRRLEQWEDGSIVLVLIPGGTLRRGSQRDRPDHANYDPWAEPLAPCDREVELEPYFLAKHELTQAQWARIAGANPSRFPPSLPHDTEVVVDLSHGTSGLHPVEQVTFVEASRVMRVLGLMLPTEAQWEWAARAGTSTPWWCGVDPCALPECANFADRSAALAHSARLSETAGSLDLDDGFAIHAPVGSLRANAFGLHDMLGNVREWCGDSGAIGYSDQTRVLTGERAGHGDGTLAVRGGSFAQSALRARSAAREQVGGEVGWPDLGLRPARRIEP